MLSNRRAKTILVGFLAVVTLVQRAALGQVLSGGIDEPPELRGEPKPVATHSEAEMALASAMPKDFGDPDAVQLAVDQLGRILTDHPDYSVAYYLRAMLRACLLRKPQYGEAVSDVESAQGRSFSEGKVRLSASAWSTLDFGSRVGDAVARQRPPPA